MRVVSSHTFSLLYHDNVLFALYLLIFFLINHCESSFAHKDCTSSCGKLDISPPFRIQGDPPYCGRANYELVCEGGKHAVFFFEQHKYIVTNIYDTVDPDDIIASGNMTVHIECEFTTKTRTCRLPDNPSFHHLYQNRTVSPFFSHRWANFMSCSQRVHNKTYTEVHSLSVENTSYVYVIVGYGGTKELNYLHESCKFVDTFPFSADDVVSSGTKILRVLQEGFNLTWMPPFQGSCWLLDFAKRVTDDNIALLNRIGLWYDSLFCLGIKACSSLHSQKCEVILFYIFYFSRPITLPLLAALPFVFKFVLAPLSVWIFLAWNCWKNTRPIDNIEKFLRNQQVLSPTRYTYGDIIAMTRHFKESLGKGGFGQVYKGELPGNHFVAVKLLLHGSKLNGEEFINEVSAIGTVHHVNIVQLLGFCSEGTNRALVYEYMPNGSLDKFIFSSECNNVCSLTLEKLNSIALGIAKGINYLHCGCDVQILHFDIKPQNILLDYNFTPKISDFGLAKLYPKDQNLISISAARGTIGYMAPELISRSFGVISCKVDVYSFGMLILEIAGRRRNVDTRMQNSSQVYFPSWVYDQLTQLEVSNYDEIIEIDEMETKLCKVGLWCIQMNSSNRPTMSEVVKLLEGDGNNVEMPPKPFFNSTCTENEVYSSMPSSSVELSVIVEEN